MVVILLTVVLMVMVSMAVVSVMVVLVVILVGRGYIFLPSNTQTRCVKVEKIPNANIWVGLHI